VQNLSLDRFQTRFWRLDQPRLSAALADKGIVIVLKRRLGRAAVTPALVGHPAKLIG
jgi:hypothetical protein